MRYAYDNVYDNMIAEYSGCNGTVASYVQSMWIGKPISMRRERFSPVLKDKSDIAEVPRRERPAYRPALEELKLLISGMSHVSFLSCRIDNNEAAGALAETKSLGPAVISQIAFSGCSADCRADASSDNILGVRM